MEAVTVKRFDLIAKLKENRENHRTIFEKAQEIYRSQIVEELDRMLEDARNGRKIRRAIMLPEPEDHTSDYDRVLAMLDMSVDEEIEIEEQDFNSYVMDHWGWERSFASNTVAYLEASRK